MSEQGGLPQSAQPAEAASQPEAAHALGQRDFASGMGEDLRREENVQHPANVAKPEQSTADPGSAESIFSVDSLAGLAAGSMTAEKLDETDEASLDATASDAPGAALDADAHVGPDAAPSEPAVNPAPEPPSTDQSAKQPDQDVSGGKEGRDNRKGIHPFRAVADAIAGRVIPEYRDYKTRDAAERNKTEIQRREEKAVDLLRRPDTALSSGERSTLAQFASDRLGISRKDLAEDVTASLPDLQRDALHNVLEASQIEFLREARDTMEGAVTENGKKPETFDVDNSRDMVVTQEPNGDVVVVNVRSLDGNRVKVDGTTGEISPEDPNERTVAFDFVAIRISRDGTITSTADNQGKLETKDIRAQYRANEIADSVNVAFSNTLHYESRLRRLPISTALVDVGEEEKAIAAAAKEAQENGGEAVVPESQRNEEFLTFRTVDIRPSTQIEGSTYTSVSDDELIARAIKLKQEGGFANDTQPVFYIGNEQYRGIAREQIKVKGVDVPEKPREEAAGGEEQKGIVIEGSASDVRGWNRLTIDRQRAMLAALDLADVDPGKVDFQESGNNTEGNTVDATISEDTRSTLRGLGDGQRAVEAAIKAMESQGQKTVDGYLQTPNLGEAAVIFSLAPNAEGASLKSADDQLQRLDDEIRKAIEDGNTGGKSRYEFAREQYQNTFGERINGDADKQRRVDALVLDKYPKNGGELVRDAMAVRIGSGDVKNSADLRLRITELLNGAEGYTTDTIDDQINMITGRQAKVAYDALFDKKDLSTSDVAKFREQFGNEYGQLASALEEKLPKVTTAADLFSAATSKEALDQLAANNPDMKDEISALRDRLFPPITPEKTLEDRLKDGSATKAERDEDARNHGFDDEDQMILFRTIAKNPQMAAILASVKP